MAQAEQSTSTNSSEIALTRKGERYVDEHSPIALSQLRRLRKEAAAEVERLLELIDRIDGDADLEDGGDREYDPAEAGLADYDAVRLYEADVALNRSVQS